MVTIGLFYGSMTGNTEEVADLIADALAMGVSAKRVDEVPPNKWVDYDVLILGVPTWNIGELEDSWEEVIPLFSSIDLSSKLVFLFGLGDQESYPDTFVDALGIIYDKITSQGAVVDGKWSSSGYEFEESLALRDGQFVGLVLDEDNQPDLTEDRVNQWVSEVKARILETQILA